MFSFAKEVGLYISYQYLSYQDQDSLLVKRRNDNHSPGKSGELLTQKSSDTSFWVNWRVTWWLFNKNTIWDTSNRHLATKCAKFFILGVIKAFLYLAEFKKIQSNWTVAQANGYFFLTKWKFELLTSIVTMETKKIIHVSELVWVSIFYYPQSFQKLIKRDGIGKNILTLGFNVVRERACVCS